MKSIQLLIFPLLLLCGATSYAQTIYVNTSIDGSGYPIGRLKFSALAITRGKNGCFVRKILVTTETTHTRVAVNQDEKQISTDFKLTCTKNEQIIIGFSDIPSIKIGKIKEYWHNEPPGGDYEISNKGRNAFILKQTTKNDQLIVTLSQNGVDTKLLETCTPSCDTLIPIWIGDLDGDGKPDFLFSWSHEEIIGGYKLYLSGGSDSPKIVAEVTTYSAC